MAQAPPDDNMTITPAEDTISAPYFDDAFTRSDTSIDNINVNGSYIKRKHHVLSHSLPR